MAQRLPVGTEEERETAIDRAGAVLARGGLAVIPTDTVYGIAADAFAPEAVAALLAAKGRGREMPPPVLVAHPETLDALAVRVPEWARALAEEFWPGPLTLVCHQQASLQWDLGETRGTVAVRVPDDGIALALLERTGPLAVSSANKTGLPAALDADAAQEMLDADVAVIVDAGPVDGGEPSTIIDATHHRPRLLRLGALGLDRVNGVLSAFDVRIESEGPEA
ncbi:L-threonylcarbamoyladenylate synthase [Nocardioides sp.]|uniref:L-threonylcarbamoyladenylate synthase n=1 Tax=Nocardioides sp. TaxID=35761 RepID=UPI0039E71A7A